VNQLWGTERIRGELLTCLDLILHKRKRQQGWLMAYSRLPVDSIWLKKLFVDDFPGLVNCRLSLGFVLRKAETSNDFSPCYRAKANR
jgi:hypothetical protein